MKHVLGALVVLAGWSMPVQAESELRVIGNHNLASPEMRRRYNIVKAEDKAAQTNMVATHADGLWELRVHGVGGQDVSLLLDTVKLPECSGVALYIEGDGKPVLSGAGASPHGLDAGVPFGAYNFDVQLTKDRVNYYAGTAQDMNDPEFPFSKKYTADLTFVGPSDGFTIGDAVANISGIPFKYAADGVLYHKSQVDSLQHRKVIHHAGLKDGITCYSQNFLGLTIQSFDLSEMSPSFFVPYEGFANGRAYHVGYFSWGSDLVVTAQDSPKVISSSGINKPDGVISGIDIFE